MQEKKISGTKGPEKWRRQNESTDRVQEGSRNNSPQHHRSEDKLGRNKWKDSIDTTVGAKEGRKGKTSTRKWKSDNC